MTSRWRGVLLVAALAASVRLPLLDIRPMHADEGILADKTGTLLEHGEWRYDASDFHGPVLEAVTAAGARVIGVRRYQDLSERGIRLVPAFAGVALAAAVGGWGGALIAVSPAMVYWSRDFIPEMLLALWSGLFLVELRKGRWWAAGLFAGLMFATKETAVLAWIAAAIAAWFFQRNQLDARRLAALIAVALAVILTLLWPLSELARVPQSLLSRASAPAHANPWWFYFSVLRWELVAGAVAAFGWKKDRFLAVYALSLMALYVALPYKTPWCALQWWWPVLALAGWQSFAAAACALVFAWVTFLTSFSRPAALANPYAYSQTLPEGETAARRIAAVAAQTGGRVQVFSTQNLWPLPWYLRFLQEQQWRRDIDFTTAPAALLVMTPELEKKAGEWLYERRPPGERGLYMRVFDSPTILRPGVELRVYCERESWDRINRRE
jgi:hypothetical protein